MSEESSTNGNGKGQIYGLIAQILKKVSPISKGRRNEQQGYRFRGIDDVYAAVHPLFAEHGVFTVPRILSEQTTERTTASGTILRFVNVTMAYDFFAPDGSSVTAEVIGEAMDAGDKASNKAMSAAQKYALIQTLCIPTGETADADFTTQPEVTGEVRQVSKSSTASEKCPECGSQMWDNRETKKGNQPDYKCKDKKCGKGVWLPQTAGFGPDQVLRDQFFNQAEKLMSGMSEERRKEALGRLVLLTTEEMGKKVNELAEAARKKGGGPPDMEAERQKKLNDLINHKSVKADDITKYCVEHFNGVAPETLSLDAITQMYDDIVIPF